jgi:hypothetical protein
LIRPVDTTLLDAVAKTAPTVPAQSGAAEATGKTAFAAQLKRAADAPATANRTTVMPDGEKWRPVKGHDDYAEIISGDRKGQMINLNRGARRGDAFTIEERDGKTVHVYKKDDGSELVIPTVDGKEARAAGTRRSSLEPPKGETWGPVKDHQSYADILSGPRNGYYVNLQQGSAREGQVFHIVKRDGKEFHVYGSGEDKVWVEVGAKKKKADAAASTNTEPTTPASGTADSRDASQTGAASGTGGATAPASGSTAG